MRWLRVFTALVVVFVAGANQASVTAAAPSQTQIYWGAVIDGGMYGFGSVPHDMRAVQAFEAHAGKHVAIIPFGATWMGGNGAFQGFDKVGFDNIRQHGSIPLYSWQSSGPNLADFQNEK